MMTAEQKKDDLIVLVAESKSILEFLLEDNDPFTKEINKEMARDLINKIEDFFNGN